MNFGRLCPVCATAMKRYVVKWTCPVCGHSEPMGTQGVPFHAIGDEGAVYVSAKAPTSTPSRPRKGCTMPKISEPYTVTVVTSTGGIETTHHPNETAMIQRLKETLRFPDRPSALVTRDWVPADASIRTGEDLIEDAEEERIYHSTLEPGPEEEED